jgi:hypothetical protein
MKFKQIKNKMLSALVVQNVKCFGGWWLFAHANHGVVKTPTLP